MEAGPRTVPARSQHEFSLFLRAKQTGRPRLPSSWDPGSPWWPCIHEQRERRQGGFSEGICGPSLSWRQWAGTGALQGRRAGGGAGSLQSAPSLNRAGGLPCPDLPKAPQACGPPRDQRPIRQLLPSPRPDGRLGTKSRFCQAQASGRHRSASPQRPASLSWTSE